LNAVAIVKPAAESLPDGLTKYFLPFADTAGLEEHGAQGNFDGMVAKGMEFSAFAWTAIEAINPATGTDNQEMRMSTLHQRGITQTDNRARALI
jgi:hypothetical protein